MIVVIVWLGFYPQPVLETVKPVLQQIEKIIAIPAMASHNMDRPSCALGMEGKQGQGCSGCEQRRGSSE
jgi:hypothetical protein